MLKIILYVVLGIVLIIVGFFTWFFMFYFTVPDLNIPEGISSKERVVLIDNWLTKLHNEHKFNGGILVVNNGQPILSKTYGYTSFTQNKKLNTNSSFRLASISKQFTASGIMLLKEKNQLNYDDLVSKYISNFPYTDVTIRHLLNQTSGIPDVYLDLAENKKDEIDVLTNEKAVDLVINEYAPLDFKSNDKYAYSNTNYIILARIIELISNQSFEDYMKDNIFIPLGMKNTRVWNLNSVDKTFEDKTGSFEDLEGEIEELKPTFMDGVAGDGGVFSSLNDFIIWDKFWYGNSLISDKNLKEAFKKPILNDGKLSNYGFGWLLIKKNVVMHNGSWLGARTFFLRNTDKKNCFVLLDNSSNLYFDKIIGTLSK